MEEGNEYLKLPIDEQCVHKLWKARVHGYEEAAKLFQQLDDEKSPEFSKYLGLVKKFVIDSNAVAQEKGLEAVLAFVENSAMAGKTVGEVMNGIVSKCIAAPKAKTKELAVQVTLMYIEIEKYEAVQEELLKGMEHKNPKIMAACVTAMTLALREFGIKIINIKPLVKKVPVLLEDRDKGVRDEGKAMVIEMYRWIGAALQPQLKDLKPVQVTELEAEFEKVKGERAVPTRYIKSQQQKQAALVASGGGGDGDDGDGNDACDAPEEIDPYDLMEPVDILSKLPKDFYEKVESKKWAERKEAMEALEQLLQAPKLESGDYGDLVRALKKIITKDTNVMVIALAAKCLAALGNGLKKRFQPYASACIPAILEKFREKKQNVVIALKEAIDAVFISTTIEAIQEDVLAALENKNPSVKAETAAFLARCFTKCTPAVLNKKILKAYTTSLLKLLNDPDPTVRDNSAEALGTAMKVVGEKVINPFMADIEAIKKTKIKECCDKAVIVAKVPVPKANDRPNTAPATVNRNDAEPTSNTGSAPKATKRAVTSAAPKKAAPKKQAASTGAKTEKIEREMTIEEVEQKAAEIFPEDVLSGLCDTNWKTRLSSVETFVQVINGMEPSEIPSQVMIQVLNKKPGLKDTNFQVLKARLEALKLLAEVSKLSSTSVELCVVDVAEKLGDPKNGVLAAEVLTSLAEASKLDLVGTLVLDFAFNQKSPKVQQEALNWLSNAIREFGLVIQPKKIIDKVKKALAATMPAVRTAGIQFVGTLYVYMGSQLTMLFENEKASLRQLIQAEFDKHAGESPPIPTRGASRNVSEDQDEDGSSEQLQEQQMNVRELMPRVDISSHITESLLEELKDKNWKVRNEAFQKLENILKENKFVTSNLGELPPVLAQRILDSNSNIAKTAIAFSQTLGIAMGSQCKNQVHVIFPSLLQSLSDNKQWIRSGAVSCMNAWGEQCGFKEFFKNEMIADVLKSDSPNLRTELWGWLAEKLTDLPPKSIPKEELLLCLPHLYANLEDRNADVRKNAQECILPFMLHLNYTTMAKATEKMKPASKSTIVGLLEKVRGSVPLKQPSAPAKNVSEDENTKTVKTAGAKAAAANKTAGKGKPAAKAGSRKKDDEADTSPVLQNNNMKHQRTIDEQKLKVLKWNFTTPREEFVELLKDQMTNAGVNKSLLANMFHSDFRYHLKAIDTLNEDLPGNGGATMANLDLILKWMTLRFFDTNPSVLIKGLEYLQLVFTMLIEEEYNMYENEAASFIPYLILKIGDPKDAVRNSVRGLFKQMEKVYPLTKLFGYIMEGLKSKNARQRTECLDLLGSLIEVYGVSVCNPSPSAALKEIAKQISDRDNSVRNAALNCVVQAYFLEGEKVYKMIGQVSDKDLCLLEERIKRAAKNRPARPSVAVSKTQQVPQQQQVQQPVESPPSSKVDMDENNQEDYSDNEEVAPVPVMRNIVPKPRPVSGPFGLDSKLLEQIEKETLDLSAPKLENFDLAEIWESPVNIPKTAFCGLGAKRDSSLPTALITAQPRQLDDCTTSSQVVDLAIAKVASSDLNEAWQANVQMEEMLNSDRANLLLGREDSLIKSCCVQLKLLYGNFDHDANLPKGYRTLLMLIIEFFDHKNLGNNVSEDALIELVENLLVLLVSGRVESFGEGHCYVRILNTILLRIIQFANPTNTTCTFLQILHKCAGSNNLPARFEELTLKCLWRLIKFLPDWEGELDILMVLQKIHNFLKDYPSSVWKKRECDNPIRTVKTILHTITKMVGGERILQYVTRIDNLSESELQPYLHRLVKKIKVEESKSKSKKPPHRLSKVTHEQLSEIFKKIGARETSQEGLELLYDFKEQHPEADVEPFLKKSSQFFQDYIERNLKIIGEKRKANDDN
ncbi:Protein mini spindles [Gryllus bimaculatus]|nr:Protein mini spindles [Gryllus bimaculatus]